MTSPVNARSCCCLRAGDRRNDPREREITDSRPVRCALEYSTPHQHKTITDGSAYLSFSRRMCHQVLRPWLGFVEEPGSITPTKNKQTPV